MTATARYWGRFARTPHAEALEVVRDSTALAEAVGTAAHPTQPGHVAPIREDIDVAS